MKINEATLACRRIDWHQVRAEYEAGGQSIAAIARRHGISRSTLYRQRRRQGWQCGVQTASQNRDQEVQASRVPADGAARASMRMIAIVNRMTDQLDAVLAESDMSAMSAADRKGLSDLVTNLTRALEKLSALERADDLADAATGARPENTEAESRAHDIWDDLQRRLARLADTSGAAADSARTAN